MNSDKTTISNFLRAFPGKYSRKNSDVPWRARIVVFERDKWSCVVCGTQCLENERKQGKLLCSNGAGLTVDHIVPKTLGATNAKYNLIALCQFCNNKKSHSQPIDWYFLVYKEMKEPENLFERILFALKLHMVDAEL